MTTAEDVWKEKYLRELASTGGLPQGRLSLELLYLVPLEFRDAYVRLFYEALMEQGTGTSYGAGDRLGVDGKVENYKVPGTRAHRPKGDEKGRVAQVGSPSGGGKRYRESWTIRSEAALKKKGEIDLMLMRAAEDLEGFFKRQSGKNRGKEQQGKDGGASVGCGKCGRFRNKDHRYCPGCGNRH